MTSGCKNQNERVLAGPPDRYAITGRGDRSPSGLQMTAAAAKGPD